MSTLKINYPASPTAIFGSTALDGLASDTNLLAGFESAVIDNTSSLYVDAHLSGRFKANASTPTAGLIQVWLLATVDGTNYPDVFDGTASVETISAAILKDHMKLAWSKVTDATANRVYDFYGISVAKCFENIMPRKWSTFVTHSMVTALNATASQGGQVWYDPVYYTMT